MTADEYLTRERAVEARHEFRDGRMVPMPPSSFAHSLAADNLCALLNRALDGTRFRAMAKAMRVKVPAVGVYTYADVLIVDGPPVLEDAHRDTLLNPCVIAEVLSDGTEADDPGRRFALYRRLPSVREYVLVGHDRPAVERYVRRSEREWAVTFFDGPDATFTLETVPAAFPVGDVYRGVER